MNGYKCLPEREKRSTQKNVTVEFLKKRPGSDTVSAFLTKPASFERKKMHMSYLIKDTTKEERERIVAESLGNIDVACDGCSPGIVKMYQAYIDGKIELKDVNMAFQARDVSGADGPEKGSCQL